MDETGKKQFSIRFIRYEEFAEKSAYKIGCGILVLNLPKIA
jgi:hypothetical protein